MSLQTIPEIEIVEISDAESEPPYRVTLHNDNVTPMDFVVEILKTIFCLSNPRAAEVMLSAHFYGQAYVQTLSRSEAENRIRKAHGTAGTKGYPLHFSMEPE